MGTKHTQAARAVPQSCSHCMSMPEQILKMRLRVAAANNQDPCLSGATPKATASIHQPRGSWRKMKEADCPDMPPLFEKFLEEDAEGDANSDLLDMAETENKEDDPTFLQWTAICTRSANELHPNWGHNSLYRYRDL